jgi:exodeoxyribonuclease I
MATTLLWHDYETWGVDPRRDRACQFAAMRTDTELNCIGDPVMVYCRPTPDFLPSPQSALVTGMTPQQVQAEGLNEAEFFAVVDEQFSRPGTCGVGYNSLRFDDEVTRFGLYRNFFDPYAREWQNGNSRWDILDLVRMTHALRPEGINWVEREPGIPGFRLDQLTVANGIAHEGAHDALADVRATIAMARLIRSRQPRLYDYYFELRSKGRAAELLNLARREMVLHVTGMYPAVLGCIAPVIPVIQHPLNKNAVVVYDLRHNPRQLLSLPAGEIHRLLYTPTDELAEGEERPPLKTVHLNKSPALAPLSTLSEEMAERWVIDLDSAAEYRRQLLEDGNIAATLTEVFHRREQYPPQDVDAALYGGFIDNRDKRLSEQVRSATPQRLAEWQPPFADKRLRQLYFRYRARNWPESLSAEERQSWINFCEQRNLRGEQGATLTLQEYRRQIEELRAGELTPEQRQILEQLEQWPQAIGL